MNLLRNYKPDSYECVLIITKAMSQVIMSHFLDITEQYTKANSFFPLLVH